MKTLLPRIAGGILTGMLLFLGFPPRADAAVRTELLTFPAHIDGRDYLLEAMIYRPADTARHSLVVFSHGRNGMFPARNPNEVYGYQTLCNALADEGHAVAFIVRRGYGNSEGPDAELQDTAVLSGLEAAKDFKAAVEYWRAKDFVLPDKVVLMGQSQGGWDVLASATVEMDGVLGVVNISGGTNYRLMGNGAVTSAVQDHWVAGCAELGPRSLVPSVWIYAENDQSINGPTARRMFNAYLTADGWDFLLMLPAYGSNGHAVVGQPDLFLGQLSDFLATIGFATAAQTLPHFNSLTGLGATTAGNTVVLVANVSGNPLPLLQWRRNGVALRNGGNLAGVTSSALTISDLQTADTGTYTIVATNPLGTTTSDALMLSLTVTLPTTPSTPNPGPSPSSGGGNIPAWFAAEVFVLAVVRTLFAGQRSNATADHFCP